MILRILLGGAGVFAFVIFCLPFRTKSLNPGNATGLVLSLFLVCYMAFFSEINYYILEMYRRPGGKILLIFLGILFGMILLYTGVITGEMIRSVRNKPHEGAVIIVLGCRVRGTRPSLMLMERILAAKDRLDADPKAVAIASGGAGKGEEITEAECVRRELIGLGVSEDRILLEDRSTSTLENLVFSRDIANKRGLGGEFAIVTNEYHEYRALKMAGRLGMRAGAVPARTVWWLLPTHYLRELYAVAYAMVKSRL
ncbi:MAG: YdcF family protein [Clostridiales bacterium]|nr:YdcF family protein [Clostridiales bacterium]